MVSTKNKNVHTYSFIMKTYLLNSNEIIKKYINNKIYLKLTCKAFSWFLVHRISSCLGS